MDDKKNFDDIEILSIDDLCEEKEKATSSTEKNRKKYTWQKVLLGTIVCLSIILVCVIGTFLAFRVLGEKNLKAEASDNIISYNGEEYRYREDIINILCLGIDKTEAMEKKIDSRDILGMSDAILLVSIDTKSKGVKIIAIPRDTMTDVTIMTETGEIQKKENMQLCYQYAYGGRAEQSGQLTVDAVSDLLYGIPIQKFCAINFEALPVLNDAIGGVDIVVQEELAEYQPEFVKGAELHLNGDLALRYVRVRNRKSVDGVVMRTQRQKQYVLAFLEKAKSAVTNDMSLPITVFQQLQENMSTNVSVADITYLLPELLDISFSEDMIQMLPGESVVGEEFLEYHADREELKKLVIDTFYEKVEK